MNRFLVPLAALALAFPALATAQGAAPPTPAPARAAKQAAPLTPEAQAVRKLMLERFPGADVRHVAKTNYFGLFEVMLDDQIMYVDREGRLRHRRIDLRREGEDQPDRAPQPRAQPRRLERPAAQPRHQEGQGQRLAQARRVLRRGLPVLRAPRADAEGRQRRHHLHVPLPDRPAAPGRRAQVADDLVRAGQGEGLGRVLRQRGAALGNSGDCDNPVAATAALGQKLKVQATPTLVFADGTIVPGALPLPNLEAELARAESEARKTARPRSGRRPTTRERGHGDHRFPEEAVHRRHRVDGRLARHALVAVPRRGQGDQERRAAHRARVAGGAVRLRRRSSATPSGPASTR